MISGKWLINAIITPAVAWFMRHWVLSLPVNRKVLHDRCLKFKLIRAGSWQLCLKETIKLHGFIPLACFFVCLFVWFIQNLVLSFSFRRFLVDWYPIPVDCSGLIYYLLIDIFFSRFWNAVASVIFSEQLMYSISPVWQNSFSKNGTEC